MIFLPRFSGWLLSWRVMLHVFHSHPVFHTGRPLATHRLPAPFPVSIIVSFGVHNKVVKVYKGYFYDIFKSRVHHLIRNYINNDNERFPLKSPSDLYNYLHIGNFNGDKTCTFFFFWSVHKHQKQSDDVTRLRPAHHIMCWPCDVACGEHLAAFATREPLHVRGVFRALRHYTQKRSHTHKRRASSWYETPTGQNNETWNTAACWIAQKNLANLERALSVCLPVSLPQRCGFYATPASCSDWCLLLCVVQT